MTKRTINWRERCLHVLQSTQYGCLATSGADGIWSNPVYFAWDADFSLYFMSMITTRHMRNIKENARAAFSIYATDQDTHGDVCGLQIAGYANILSHEQNVAQAFRAYFNRIYPGRGIEYGDKVDNPYAYHPDWHFVRIAPQEIHLFDTANFGETRQPIPFLSFNV